MKSLQDLPDKSTISLKQFGDCAYCVQRIDDMLFDEDYAFASDTLEGIRDTILKTNKVTEKQLTAVDNIEASVKDRGNEGDNPEY